MLVLVRMVVVVRVIVTVIMVVPVHGAVRMPMLVSVLVAFDLRFAAAATACRAHTVLLGPPQAISMSFTRISSPCVTCNW
jgi:NAD/NADP transhydrogenase beta subunit